MLLGGDMPGAGAGRTVFSLWDHALADVQVGEAWLHPSGALHRARASESRYVLVGFVDVRPRVMRWWSELYGWGALGPGLREWRGGELVAEARRSWFRVATRLVRRSLPEALQCAEGLVLVGSLALLLFLYCLHTYVRVVEWAACRGEATSVPPPPPAAPVVTPSSSSSRLAAFMASVPQQKSPIAEPAPRTTSRLAEFVAAVPNR